MSDSEPIYDDGWRPEESRGNGPTPPWMRHSMNDVPYYITIEGTDIEHKLVKVMTMTSQVADGPNHGPHLNMKTKEMHIIITLEEPL